MYFLKHADDESSVFDSLPEYIVSLRPIDAADDVEIQAVGSDDDPCTWPTSDEAAFWMGM